MSPRGLVVDLFAGGGGASTGLEAALGRRVDIAINHNPVALAVHEANHPETAHLTASVWDVDPKIATRGRPVSILWASPDCTHFSRAKGGRPREQRIRSLAWVVVDWARAVRPQMIFVENVGEFVTWGPLDAAGQPIEARSGETFNAWRGALELLGYRVDFKVLDASRFGAPTRRRRLFLVARRDGESVLWPAETHGTGAAPFRTAAECIDWSLPCPSIFERRKPLAEKTLRRIAEGIRRFVIETASPFIVKVNHGGKRRPEGLGEPLSTVTATQRGHALVAPTLIQTGYGERPGQRPRCLDLHEPMGTVVAGGSKQALIAAFLVKHYGGVIGHGLERPVGTVTAKDHHSLVTAALDGSPDHRNEVRAFLMAYYGNGADVGQDLREPMRTVVTRDRFGLVVVDGVEHAISDIGMRMLEPHELLRAQFGRFAEGYDLTAAKTKSAKVRLIGNSVCPEVVEALVRANVDAGQIGVAA